MFGFFKKKSEKTKWVAICCATKSGPDGDECYWGPVQMTRKQFLEHCADFFDNRGTQFNDFELMQVCIKN